MLLHLNARIRPGIRRPLGILITEESNYFSEKKKFMFAAYPIIHCENVNLDVFEMQKKNHSTRLPYLKFKDEIDAVRM
jgi:hypothetical protein